MTLWKIKLECLLTFFNLGCFTWSGNLTRKRQVVEWVSPGDTEGESISVQLTSCLTGLDYSVWKIKTKIFSCHTADSKPVKQEVNGTMILPHLVFPGLTHVFQHLFSEKS